MVVTGPRGRFQTVDTAVAHRRRGICTRLVVEAAQRTAAAYAVEHFVICADPEYHALGLYESLGFFAVERVTGALLRGTSS
jgi:ribosomal protein S18 acetylase RimI-like enzyme